MRADLAVGSTARVIAKKVGQWNPNLIVLGLEGGAESRRRYFSVLRRIAIEAKCSVRVARIQRRNRRSATRPAVRGRLEIYGSGRKRGRLARLAERHGNTILTVVNPFDYSIPEIADKAIERAKSLHHLIANELDRAPVFTSSVVGEGEPEKFILRVIDEWKPDSVFLAPHRRSRLSRSLLRGVSGPCSAGQMRGRVGANRGAGRASQFASASAPPRRPSSTDEARCHDFQRGPSVAASNRVIYARNCRGLQARRVALPGGERPRLNSLRTCG